jgi:4-amino-4-deoxy-L-arabinose transferase-like glycosyltransferase
MESARPVKDRRGFFDIARMRSRLAEPEALVALLAVGQILAWTLAPALTHSAPPLDVVEGYMWGREWVIATYKHPGLVSWVLEASRVATGVVGWPAYLIAQVFVAVTFICVFLLGRDLLRADRAAAGTLLLTGIAYYAWPTPEFNHNVAQLPFWAGVALALWRAIERGSLFWWLVLAVCAAGGLYAKLSTGLLLIAAGLWVIGDRQARRALTNWRPWVSVALFALLIAPLAMWLATHWSLPLTYALEKGAHAQGGIARFALNVLLNLSGAVLMLAAAGLIGARSRGPAASPASAVETRNLNYLLVLTVAPVALAMAAAVVVGSLKSAWAAPMFNLVGLLAIAICASRFDSVALHRIAACATAALVLVPLGYALTVVFWLPLTGKALRVNWPQSEIALRMSAVWVSETRRPLRIVSGESWVAGLIGLTAEGRPSIFTEADPALSPWIGRERVGEHGILVAWDALKGIPDRAMRGSW